MSIEEAEERCRALLHVVLAVAHLNRRERRERSRKQGRDCRESNPAVTASLCQSQVRVF